MTAFRYALVWIVPWLISFASWIGKTSTHIEKQQVSRPCFRSALGVTFSQRDFCTLIQLLAQANDNFPAGT